METRNVKVSLETAKRWYVQGGEFKEMALSAYTESELSPIRNEWESKLLNGYIEGYCINLPSNIGNVKGPASYLDKNVFKTEKQAKSALAYAQLTQLMALPEYNGDWVPDWSDNDNVKHVIRRYFNEIDFDYYSNTHHFLAFKSAEIRDRFYENNYDLLKEYFELN